MSDAERFLKLFEGSPTASYSFDSRLPEGQRYTTVYHGLTLADIERHLVGQWPSALSIPILPSGLCNFFAGDADRHQPTDQAVQFEAVAQRITKLGLPCVLTRSKSSKSAHVWTFLKSPFDAALSQKLVAEFLRLLEIENNQNEIFPKQVSLADDKIGSGINLPYFGGERYALGRDGEVLTLTQFLDLAESRAAYGEKLAEIYLTAGAGAVGPSDGDRPMLAATARRIHQKNLQELSSTTSGRNNKLNDVGFFAGRAFAAKIFSETAEEIRVGIKEAGLASGLRQGETESTLDSGWNSGLLKPLKILEDPFPEATATLAELNEKYFVVTQFGGKCRVCWEEINPKTRSLILEDQDFAEFKKAYQNKMILTGSETRTVGRGKNQETLEVPTYQSKAEFWLNSPQRREYRRVRFAPNETLPPDIKNLWRGFQVEPKQGKIPRFLEHVYENICQAKQERYDWLMRWEAWKARNPGLQNGSCLVLIGPEGVGKNVAIDAFSYLFGPHCFVATKPEHVTGHFNAHMRACCLLIGNEALYAGNKRDSAVLKGLITDDMIVVEGKGVNAVMEENRVSVCLISNEAWSVPAGIGARRFAVFDVSAKHKQDYDYFNVIALELGGVRGTLPGYRALLHHLLYEVELKDFRPQQIILTDALVGQQAQSLRGSEALWHTLLFRGEMPGLLPNNQISFERILTWAKLQRDRRYDGITDRSLGMLLGENTLGDQKGMGFKHADPRPVVAGKRIRAWQIPSLRECRKLWDELRFIERWPALTELSALVTPGAVDPDDWQDTPVGDERLTLTDAAAKAVQNAVDEQRVAGNLPKSGEPPY